MKDRLIGSDIMFHVGSQFMTEEEILKNQEDAEKFHKVIMALAQEIGIEDIDWLEGEINYRPFFKRMNKLMFMEQRLKKRIEELKITSGEPIPDLLSQLQKILDGKC